MQVLDMAGHGWTWLDMAPTLNTKYTVSAGQLLHIYYQEYNSFSLVHTVNCVTVTVVSAILFAVAPSTGKHNWNINFKYHKKS